MFRIALLAAAAALALGGGSAAIAQGLGGAPPPKAPDPKNPPRKISQEYANRLMQMWDLNGSWDFTQPDPKVHIAIFDPKNAHVPYEWSDELPAFGPVPGSYMTTIPFKPEYQKKYMETVKNNAEGRVIDDFGSCKPFGMPRLMGGAVGGFDVLEGPDVIFLHFPMYHEFRKIFLDGRPHPPKLSDGDIDTSTWTGHSTGRFEGDTLVIETVNILPSFYDQTGARTSGEAKVTERWRLVDANTIENRMTIEDPVQFTKPWEVTRVYIRSRAGRRGNEEVGAGGRGRSAYRNMRDQECVGVDMSKGYQSVVLPMEEEAAKAAETKK